MVCKSRVLEVRDELEKRHEDLLPLEAVEVEVVRVPVGREEADDAVVGQLLEKTTQDHRVHDVRHLEFVETKETALRRNLYSKTAGTLVQRECQTRFSEVHATFCT